MVPQNIPPSPPPKPPTPQVLRHGQPQSPTSQGDSAVTCSRSFPPNPQHLNVLIQTCLHPTPTPHPCHSQPRAATSHTVIPRSSPPRGTAPSRGPAKLPTEPSGPGRPARPGAAAGGLCPGRWGQAAAAAPHPPHTREPSRRLNCRRALVRLRLCGAPCGLHSLQGLGFRV